MGGPKNRTISKFSYWIKALKWFLGNLIFGLVPLILMGLTSLLTHGKRGQDHVDHLIYEGAVLVFVLIAIMGSVVIDYLLSGFPSVGKQVFYIYIFPLCVLGFISIVFFLRCFDAIEKEIFGLFSYVTIIMFFLSFVYCTFTKANLFIKEETYGTI